VINPTNPDNLIAAWQQDRSFGARGNVVGYSTDGGESWDVVVVPGANTCSPGQLGVADAWLTFDGGGTAYLASLGGREGDGNVVVSGVILNTSTDGGRTWSPSTNITAVSTFDDKPSITGDPYRSGVVYATWERSQGESDCSNGASCLPVVLFSRSEDSAASWSEPQAVAVPTDGFRQNNARIVVLPTGSLRLFYEDKPDVDGSDASGVEQRLLMVRSDDSGRTWSQPHEILTVQQYHPFTPTDGRFYTLLNEAVTADDGGNLYVVSTHNDEAETATQSRVELLVSHHGGENWVSETVASLAGFATLPTVAASRTHGIAVTWYDFAADTEADAGVTLAYRAATQPVDADLWTSLQIVNFDLERCGLFSREGLPGPQVPWIDEYFGLVPLANGRFGTALVACAPAADLGLEDILYTTFR